jgi:hypothetical protein
MENKRTFTEYFDKIGNLESFQEGIKNALVQCKATKHRRYVCKSLAFVNMVGGENIFT